MEIDNQNSVKVGGIFRAACNIVSTWQSLQRNFIVNYRNNRTVKYGRHWISLTVKSDSQ